MTRRWEPRFEPDLPGVIAVALSSMDSRVHDLREQLGYEPAAVRPTSWCYTDLAPEGRAVPAEGPEVPITSEELTIVQFDDKAYALVPYRGVPLAPGPVWILSPKVGWKPQPARIERVEDGVWRAGPLDLSVVEHADRRRELVFEADGVRLGAHAFAGDCAPAAVWLIEPQGPAIVVLYDHEYVVCAVGAASAVVLHRIKF